MWAIKRRLPARDEIFYGLLACVLPIFIWTLVFVFYELPAWVKRMTTWELVGAISYSQFFALIETLVVFLVILIIAVILPKSIFRFKFIALTAMVIYVSAFWFIFAHYFDAQIRSSGIRLMLLWVVFLFVSIIASYIVVRRSDRVSYAIEAFVHRTSVLSLFYLLVGMIGLVIVVIRNITGAL